MARPLRVVFPGAVYHVIARGNNRQRIFWAEADFEAFYEVLGQVVDRYGWRLHSYCVLGNHYHLLVETPRGNLSEGMRQLNGVFAKRYNVRRRRVGHLFQARFAAILVESERHLRWLVRYIANNPVEAGICERASDWRHGSFRALIGLEQPRPFLTVDWILGLFGSDRQRLRRYVERAHAEPPPLVAGIYACSEPFVRERIGDRDPIAEVRRREWQPLPPSLNEIFACEELPVAVAYRRYGYTMAEIAQHLGCHYSTISRRLRREEEQLPDAARCRLNA